jgi:glycosyltransferase involved in cell wall biosynthesis
LVLSEKPESLLEEAILADLQKPHVAVGIPAYNEEQSIARIVIEAQKHADTVIVCDDGSTDLTAQIAERLGADVIRHDGNCGYGAAIKSLFKRTLEFGADVLVTLDGDGQHDASEIPQVIRPIIEGNADVVIGSRFIDDKGTAEMPLYRQLGAKVITKIVNGSSKQGVSDSQSGFRAYNRQALECLSVSEVGMGASVQILLQASKQNLKIREVSSTCKYENGDVSTSTENPISHGLGVISSIIRIIVEEKPLTVLGIPGILCLFAGTAFGFWMLQIYALTHSIVTNIALASLAFVIFGFFMVSTSITLYAITRLTKKRA